MDRERESFKSINKVSNLDLYSLCELHIILRKSKEKFHRKFTLFLSRLVFTTKAKIIINRYMYLHRLYVEKEQTTTKCKDYKHE